MISVFICIGPYTNDRRRLNRKKPQRRRGVVWGGAVLPPHKIVKFYSGKCCILVHFIIIRSNQLFLAIGQGACPPYTAIGPLGGMPPPPAQPLVSSRYIPWTGCSNGKRCNKKEVLKIHANIKLFYICLKMYANRRNFCVFQEIGVNEHNVDVRF